MKYHFNLLGFITLRFCCGCDMKVVLSAIGEPPALVRTTVLWLCLTAAGSMVGVVRSPCDVDDDDDDDDKIYLFRVDI